MAPNRTSDSSSWLSKRTCPPSHRIPIVSNPFKLDQGLVAKRSAKVASLLEENPHEDLSAFFQDIRADHESFELMARFCHGFEISMTSDNIIPLICLSHYLKMTETHSTNNLLEKALVFFENQVLLSWDETIRSLRAAAVHAFQQATDIGLFEHCLEALSAHALSRPSLLGEPIIALDDNPNGYFHRTVSARRNLFGSDHSSVRLTATNLEDLTSLPVEIYEPIIRAMAQRRVPQDHIAGSLYQYLRRHVSCYRKFYVSQVEMQQVQQIESCSSSYAAESDTKVIEAIERLLPSSNKYLLPCTYLVEIYTLAVSLGASSECRNGLEIRIAKQLDRATVKDLLALDIDVKGLRRILKGYYGSFTDPNPRGLVAVAELMEGYLIEVATGWDHLDVGTFVEVAEMVGSTTSVGTGRVMDGIYRAIDVYLEKHMEMSEGEREEVCRVLDFSRMSAEGCDHAAQNQRLPLRVVVQALFVSQLQLRDNIIKAMEGQNGKCNNVDKEEEEEGEIKGEIIKEGEEEEWGDHERIEIRDHENKCCRKMNKGKKKVSLWKEMKRKFGCMGSSNYITLPDCNCQVNKRKKVHPK